LGDWSDDDEGENLERKMARLRREIEEVREEAEGRRLAREREGGNINDAGADKEIEDAAALSRLLDGISMSHEPTTLTPASRLAQSLSADISPSTAQPTSTTPSAESTAQEATYTITYAPNFLQSHSLVKASAIDARLTEIEKALGLPSTLSAPPIPLLPTLDSLTSQLHLLATTTPTSLESVSRRIRGLITETERLTAARKEAKAAISNDEDAGMVSPGIGDGENLIRDAAAREQASKITALYGTLTTIESLAPALPGVLERLRSLRKVHAEAAGVAERWTEAIMRQEDMGAEIEKWREGLEKVELAVKNGERVGGENAKVVEGWVRDLEQRLKRLEG
jgi:nuclear migration protein JNM1